MNVEITHQSEDKLISWTWRFWFYDGTLWLDDYMECSRPTRRHVFRVEECYYRLNTRHSTLKEPDVVLPATVKDEALKKLFEGVTVRRWSERG